MTLAPIRNYISDSNVVFIHDQKGDVHYGKLRSLPAISYLDISHATYPTSWRQLKHTWEYERGGAQYEFPGYDYHVIGNINIPSTDNLCVVTTSYYEHQTQYSINHLIDRYTRSNGTLIVIADQKHFQPVSGLRPLYMEPFCKHIGSYDKLYKHFKDYYNENGWDHPLLDTRNLFLQDNANLYELVEGETIDSVTGLFDVLTEAPYLPLYKTFSEIFARKDQRGVVPLESHDTVKALGGWLRRRIELDKGTANDIAHDMNLTVTHGGTAFDPSYARRSPKMQDAKEAIETLNPNTSSIEARYRDLISKPL